MARAGHPHQQHELPAVRRGVNLKILERWTAGPKGIGGRRSGGVYRRCRISRFIVGIELPDQLAAGAELDRVMPAIAATEKTHVQPVAGGKYEVVHDGLRQKLRQ